ncbi:MAG: hypothetical protein ABW007_19480 [Chitinophagaceae bacterium]
MRYEPLKEILIELGLDLSRPRDDGWMTGNCPFASVSGHKDKTSKGLSFYVRVDKRRASGFNCYVCGRKGNIEELITMLGAVNGVPMSQRVPLIYKAQKAEADLLTGHELGTYELAERPLVIDQAAIKGMYQEAWRVKEAREYLQKRWITEPTATLLGLLYSGTIGPPLDHNRIMFPLKNRKGELYGFSGRAIHDNAKVKAQDMLEVKKQFCLLGSEHIVEGDRRPIILVEGLFAYASLYEIGADRYGYPIATLGSTMSKWQAELLLDWGLPVYCFYDNDAAGHKGIYGYTTEAGRKVKGVRDWLSGHPTLVPPWPVDLDTNQPLTDPDQLELATVASMMEAAKPLT